jgi:hypothetical protein
MGFGAMRAHRFRIFLLLFAGLVGCASVEEQQESMVALSVQVQDLEAQLTAAHDTLQVLSSSQHASQETLTEQFANVSTQLDNLPNAMRTLCAEHTTPTTECVDQGQTQTVVMSGDKMVVGELEKVWIDPPGAVLIARIDTGAQSSSVHAENMVEFERDGEDWVRFNLTLDDEARALERRVVRYVRVYQQADRNGTRRPVVSMRLRLGDVQSSFEFTLADRSHLEHQMILGRNFLADMALVDVGKQFIQPPHGPPKG